MHLERILKMSTVLVNLTADGCTAKMLELSMDLNDPNYINNDGTSVINVAAFDEYVDVINIILLDFGNSVNDADSANNNSAPLRGEG